MNWRIENEDFTKFLKRLDPTSVDAVITDPPYGLNRLHVADLRFRGRRDYDILNDADLSMFYVIYDWCQWYDIPFASFYSPYNPPRVRFGNVLAWSKGRNFGIGGGMRTTWKRDFELIGVSFNRCLDSKDSAVLNCPPPTKDKKRKDWCHPNEKPVELLKYLVRKLTKPGGTVFDPMAGTASTGVAAVQMGRRFIGCEIDVGWHRIAGERLRRSFKTPELEVGD